MNKVTLSGADLRVDRFYESAAGEQGQGLPQAHSDPLYGQRCLMTC